MANFTPNPTLDKITGLAQRVGEAIAASPAGELEKNARQHFISQLAKQGLVTREEFDAQRALLEKTRAKLHELEAALLATTAATTAAQSVPQATEQENKSA